MAIPIQLKRSTAAGVSPTTLADGEVAINVAASDPKLFYKDSASTIRAFSLASYASASHTHSASQISVSQQGETAFIGPSASYFLHELDSDGIGEAIQGLGGLFAADITDFATEAAKHGPVTSVNSLTGTIVLTSLGVSAASAVHSHVAADISDFTSVANVVSVNAKTGVVSISHTDVTAASASHNHAASDVTSGTFDAARLPLATTGAAGAVIVGTGLGVSSGTVSVTYGTSAGTACQGNDARLSDTRTPTDGSVTTAKLANDAVTYAKLQNVSATDRLLGRSSAGAGDVEEITCTAFGRSLIDDADAAAARTTLGVQPTASPTFTGVLQADVSNDLLDSRGNLRVFTTDTQAIDKGGSIGLGGKNGFGTFDPWAFGVIKGAKENGTSGNFSGYLAFGTANAGGTITERLRINSDGQLLVTAGSASAPGVAISGDTNTGMFSPSADVLAWATAGSERVRVNASGMVLCSSGFALQGESRPTSGAGLEVNYVSASNAATIGAYDRTGNVYKELHLFGSVIDFQIGAGSSMRLNAGGELLIGTTTDNGNFKLQVNSQIYATNATIATSDARFKTRVESLNDATSVIEALRPVAFDFIPHEERNFATERQVGLIAQEAQSALAGCDYADSVVAQCGDHLGLAYEKLVPVLIKALQESNARIAALEERINA